MHIVLFCISAWEENSGWGLAIANLLQLLVVALQLSATVNLFSDFTIYVEKA